MVNEEWKDIKDYEGLYQISSLGRIKSIERNVRRVNYSGRITTKYVAERIKIPCINNTGYAVTSLSKNNITKRVSIHRLIAEAFIPNPNNKPMINHKNGDRTDYRIENLEWVTAQENIIHSFRELGRRSPFLGKKGAECKNSKPCVVIGPNGFEKTYPALQSACDELGLSPGTAALVARNIRKQTKGYRIFYKQAI